MDSHDYASHIAKRPFDAYEGDEKYIFVSYAHIDADKVFVELKRFHDQGFNIWYDEGISSGSGWQEVVENTLVKSSLFVVFISKNSIESQNVREEIFLAIDEKIPIIPIYLEKTKLKHGLRLKLSSIQSILKYEMPENEYINRYIKDFERFGFKKPEIDLTKECLREFNDLNNTTDSIFDLEDNDVVIILNDGTNLTNWDDVSNTEEIIYLIENLSDYTDLSDKYKNFKSLKAISASGVTDKVTTLKNMFYGCSSLICMFGLEDWDVSNVNRMDDMFDDCSSLVDLSPLNDWDVSNVSNMKAMFWGCRDLVDLSPLMDWDVSNTDNMWSMFSNCDNLADLSPLKYWNISNVTTMRAMFANCGSLVDLSPLKKWNISNVTTMRAMFYNCDSLVDLSPLKKWDVSNVDNMRAMFYGCDSLVDLSPLNDWDVSNVSNMVEMFYNCSSLVEVCLKDWDVSNVSNMEEMFCNCTALVDLSSLNDWDVSDVTNIEDMFYNSDSITTYPDWFDG